jgi:hypothetical protein
MKEMLMKRFKLIAAALAVASMMMTTSRVCAQSASDVKEEVDAYKDEVNSGIGTLSSRISDLETAGKLKFKGDFRFRYEDFSQSQDNSPFPKAKPTGNMAIPDRARYRVRLRFGAEKQFGDEVYTAFRLVTGSQGDPTSSNQTLGDDGASTKEDVFKTVLIDQAYLKYTPSFLGGKVDVFGGKYANILDSTAITWDGDVTPEGIASAVRLPLGLTAKGQYMILAENSSARDQYLTNAQLSRDFVIGAQNIHVMAGYEFVPWVSSMAVTTGTVDGMPAIGVPFQVTSKNNMVLNSVTGRIPNIEMIEGMVVVKNKVAKVPLKWTFHAARNTNSFDLNKATTNNAVKVGSLRNADAFFVKLDLGTAANKGDLNGALQWGYIEPNAVLGLYSDSDSGMGYNNQKWLKVDVGYMLTDALQLNLGQYAAKRVNYDVLSTTVSTTMEKSSRNPMYRTQLDFIVKI